MRKPEYLSPTSINLYHKDPEEFYIRYLSEFRPPRTAQTQPMAIGSAFDAYVKSYLHEKLFGKGTDPTYELRTLFEKQVEQCNWNWAWKRGERAFDMYRESGALADMLIDLEQAVGQPKFEIEIRGIVSGRSESTSGSVMLLGKPDVYYINKFGNPVILDWKVNGWCAKTAVSPKKGYLRLRHGSTDRSKDKDMHRECQPMLHQGMMINVGLNLEVVDKDWATQLAIYGWLCGMDIGSEFVTGLDQLACSPNGTAIPDVRIAEHRLRVGKTFQWEVFARALEVWDVCQNGHVFQEMSKEQSERVCEALDAKAKAITEMMLSGTPEDKAFLEITGG